MRISPIIRKLFKRLSARYFVPRMAQTLATVSISASAVMLLVAFPTASAEQPAQEKEAPAQEQLHAEKAEQQAAVRLHELDADSAAVLNLDELEELDENGILRQSYYRFILSDIPSVYTAGNAAPAYHWVNSTSGQTLQITINSAEAHIVYSAETDANGLHIAYTDSEVSFGNGDATVEFYWDLDNFGKFEAFHDTTANSHVWDATQNKWVDSGTVLHYEEIFDEYGMPLVGSGRDEFRWVLKQGNSGEKKVLFHYDGDNMHNSRVVAESGTSISETFKGLDLGEESMMWKRTAPDIINLVQSNKGGAVEIGGDKNISGNIEASFVGNSSLSSIHVLPEGGNISLNGKNNNISNKSLGGAIYNAGTISGNFSSNFAGNETRSEVVLESTVFFKPSSDVLNITSIALGGALYNKGDIQGPIFGDFVGNSAYAIHFPKGGTNVGVLSTENITLLAKGGAIYNIASAGDIEGNYIGNSARSQISMAQHGAATYAFVHGTYEATGGAIYNGVNGKDVSSSGQSSINDISAVFVGNYAYNYHLTQQGPAGSTTVKLSDYVTIKTYASGGAIFNGVEQFGNASTTVQDRVSSSIGDISGIFVDNFAYDTDPYVCGEFYNESLPDNSSLKYVHRQLGDWYVNKRHHALGGAIYNGVSVSTAASTAISAYILSIAGEFTGNYVYIKNLKSLQDSSSGSGGSSDQSTMRNYAAGGAVYNGLEDITIQASSSVVSEITEGINANFTGNYAYIMRQHGQYYGDDLLHNSTAGCGIGYMYETDYAAGGAIYNGLADISTYSGFVTKSHIKVGISGVFTDNHAAVKNSAYRVHTYALGGAVYNGIHYTSFGDEVIGGNIASIIDKVDNAQFIGNYVYMSTFSARNSVSSSASYMKPDEKIDYALGGAIYNGVIGITGDDRHIEGDIAASMGVIGSIGIDNSPNVIFSDNRAHTYNTMYGSSTTTLAHFAYGGAIYNGLEKISDGSTGTSISASISQLVANFNGNHAWNETQMDGVYHALGGAVYNGINDAHVTDGIVAFSAVINEGIDGIFSENYAANTTSAQNGQYHAFGGAIYNGLSDVSPGDESISFIASIGDIGMKIKDSVFAGNYATNVSSVTALGEYLASGGAIYNGIGTIANQTTPETIYTSIDKIRANFSNNYAGIGDTASKQVTQRALGGAIYNGIASVDGIGSSITNKQEGTPASITLDYVRWEDNERYPYNSTFQNTYTESAKYTNYGKFINDVDGNHLDPKYFDPDVTNLNLKKPSPILRESGWTKLIESFFVHGAIENSPGISSSIGDIIGNFTENLAVGESVAYGGAIDNVLDGVKGASSDVTNTFNVSMQKTSAVQTTENISVEMERELKGQYIAPVAFSNSVLNEGGIISATIDSIQGEFHGNVAKTTGALHCEANGGAISNSLSELYAGSVNLSNNLIVTSYYAPRVNSKGSSIIFNDDMDFLFLIDNKFAAEITNIQNGLIGASIGDIKGSFSGNYADSRETARGGAIHNRLGSIAGGGGAIHNTNGTSNIGGNVTMYYLATGVEGIKAVFSDDITKTNNIINNISVFFNNGIDMEQDGGSILVKIGKITADFANNYAEGSSALGGAIYNGIETVGGGIGAIENTNNILYYYYSWGVKNDSSKLLYEGDNKIIYNIENNYQAGISNIHGEIISSIDNIAGDFAKNHVGDASSESAHGGAVHNSLGRLSAGSITITNDNYVSYQYYETSTNISAEATDRTRFTGQDHNEALITNNINVAIDNRQGKIQSKIGDITGDFIENYAKGQTANGGAIFNSINELSAATITISNRNVVSDVPVKLKNNMLHDPENITGINNNIQAGFINQGGVIAATIGDISGEIFSNNFADGAIEANGGAIYNGIGQLLGAVIEYKLGKGLSADTITGSVDNSYGGQVLVSIGCISNDFVKNYVVSNTGNVNGGAIYNSIGSIGNNSVINNSDHGVFAAQVGQITSDIFSGNYATSEQGKAKGGAIYNGIGSIGDHVEIDNSHGGVLAAAIGSLSGDFSQNYTGSTNGDALGGAIYNGIGAIGEEVKIDNTDAGITAAHIKEITSDFKENYATSANGNAYGGAIYNGVESGEAAGVDAIIGDISGTFTDNKTVSTEAEAQGGAIYNSGSIGNIEGTFATNHAEAHTADGGAIYNSGSIDNITGDIHDNYATSVDSETFGGAIYNSGSIGNITGNIRDNYAKSKDNETLGGAIYNSGSIGLISDSTFTTNGFVAGDSIVTSGGAIYNDGTGSITSIDATKFAGNKAETLGSALTNIGSIGEIVADATPTPAGREYDNSLIDGIVNTDFTGNSTAAAADAERAAALYTETSLAIIARDSNKVLFDQNAVGNNGVTRDLYVAAGAAGEMPNIYMVAEAPGSITTNGEILGEKGFVLRLRGHEFHAAEQGHARGGEIKFGGLVINADVIMDDVTLKLGTKKATDHGRYTAEDAPYMEVYDDTLKHRDGGLTLLPTDHPSGNGVDYDGNKGEVGSISGSARREYSDVLRMSRLEARSGQVHTAADRHIVNYNIGTIVTNGRMAYDMEQGYYADPSIHATWAIDINLSKLKADTFTTWYKEGEDNKMAQSKGYMTLSGCSIYVEQASAVDFDGVERHEPHDQSGEHRDASSGLVPTDKYPQIDEYYDATIQVINLIKQDADGRDVTPEEWKEAGDITTSAPLQLDLGELSVKGVEHHYMNSNYLLCEGIGYGTTKTYHDSIRIWGWRDNLAAWAEWAKSGDAAADGKEYGKEFVVIGGQTLTRNIKRNSSEALNADVLLQEKELIIRGNVAGTGSVLDVNGYNLLAEVAKGQTLELRNLTISNVGTGDARRAGGSINNKTQVDGTLILDTLAVDEGYTVMNDSKVIRRGNWDIYYTITSHQSGAAVENTLHLQDGKAEITGTVEHQNIINETKDAYTILQVNTGLDNVNNAGKSYELWTKDETGQFRRFVDNSLTMQAGRFDLNNLNRSELILRDFNVNGGILNVNSVTVDLSAKAEIAKAPGAKVDGWNEGHMGMIWATESADYDAAGNGKIWVHRVQLLPRDGKESSMRIPVQFVNPEVGEAVVPFGEDNDYGTPNAADNGHTVSKTRENQFGQVFVYNVHYDYTTGQYIYERVVKNTPGDNTPGGDTPGGDTPGGDTPGGDPVVNPNVQASPAATLAGGIASLMQVNDYVFEHADLFSAHVYSAQKARLRERSFTIVTPTKGKNAVAKAPAPKASCSYLAGFKGGMWVRPYAGYEKLPLSGGPKVTNSLYGALVGGDTELKEHKNGWSSVFSAHAAYMGSTQRYTERGAGVRISQNGGGVGLTGTFYYKNFYTALTGTVATSGGHASGSQGTENFRTVMGGVASRSGYNIEFGKGRYVLQPTLLASFTSIHMPDYTNAAGAHITANPLNVLQLHPYVKFIMNTDSCWEPYFTLGYVHNLTGKTSYRANGIKLPEMSIDPYVEYSVGVQKTWADKYTIFGQATGRNGGRNGVEFSAGLRCTW